MTQKEVSERMAVHTRHLQRGTYSIHDCESLMNNEIAAAVRNMEGTVDERIQYERKLKRRMWRMLLEATKKQGVD